MRPPKPPKLIEYEKLVNQGPPRYCHNCDDYNQDGYCVTFGEAPPAEFASSEGACKNWVLEIPF